MIVSIEQYTHKKYILFNILTLPTCLINYLSALQVVAFKNSKTRFNTTKSFLLPWNKYNPKTFKEKIKEKIIANRAISWLLKSFRDPNI